MKIEVKLDSKKMARLVELDLVKDGFTQTVPVRYQHQGNCGGTHAAVGCRIAAWLKRVRGQRKKNWTNLPRCIRGTSSKQHTNVLIR